LFIVTIAEINSPFADVKSWGCPFVCSMLAPSSFELDQFVANTVKNTCLVAKGNASNSTHGFVHYIREIKTTSATICCRLIAETKISSCQQSEHFSHAFRFYVVITNQRHSLIGFVDHLAVRDSKVGRKHIVIAHHFVFTRTTMGKPLH
jgi:hypothetical protein